MGIVPAFAADEAAAPAAPTAPAIAAPASVASAYSRKGADTCLACHDDAGVTGIFHTKHARPNDPRGPFGHGGLQCEACHGPGGAHVQAGGGPLAGMVDFGPKAQRARGQAECAMLELPSIECGA